MVAKCSATVSGKEDCPLKHLCVARLNDKTITGCGLPLALDGHIPLEDVMVRHTVMEVGNRRTDDGHRCQTGKEEKWLS